MKPAHILQHRLKTLHLTGTNFSKPEEIVQNLVAVQSQDYAMAKWALGLRLPGTTEAMMDKAFDDGLLLRTHVMRPTWHFVTAPDIRWLLKLTGPRVHACNASISRQLKLDAKTFKRCHTIMTKALQGNNYLTRTELQKELTRAKIEAEGLRLIVIMMHAELEGLICSGPRKGKQFTYALLDERVPAAKTLTRDEALSELTLRYFKTRGPATVQDYSWWSGLTIKEVKEGVSMLKGQLTQESLDGREYIFVNDLPENPGKPISTFLMPDYDEYGISYKDRSILLGKQQKDTSAFFHMIVIDGVMGGIWKRTVKGKKHLIETSFFGKLNQRQMQAVNKSIKQYQTFFGNI